MLLSIDVTYCEPRSDDKLHGLSSARENREWFSFN